MRGLRDALFVSSLVAACATVRAQPAADAGPPRSEASPAAGTYGGPPSAVGLASRDDASATADPTVRGCEPGPIASAEEFFDCFRSDYGSGNLGWCDVNLNQSLANVEAETGARLRLDADDVGMTGPSATATICGRSVTLSFTTAERRRARVRFITIGREPGDAASAWALDALMAALHEHEGPAVWHGGHHEQGGREQDDDSPQYHVGGVTGQTIVLKPDEGVIMIGYDEEFD